MPVNDEHLLQDRLVEEFDLVDPGFAPVDAAIRQGRAIRARRRAGLACGLATVAVLGVAVPFALGQRHGGAPGVTGPADPTGHRVTVEPPWVDGAGDTRFRGSIDGLAWTAVGDHRNWCVAAFAACMQSDHRQTNYVDLAASGQDSGPVHYGAFVGDDVEDIALVLTDGERLTLRPVGFNKSRMALFELPREVGISRITAVDAGGKEIAHSIPYNRPGRAAMATTWYRPDEQPTQVEASGPILTGTTDDGARWEVDAATGPFGVCVVDVHVPTGVSGGFDDDVSCEPAGPIAETVPSFSRGAGGPYVLASAVRPDVARIDVLLSDGTTSRLVPVRVGGRSFAAIRVPAHTTITSMTAYDAAGGQLVNS